MASFTDQLLSAVDGDKEHKHIGKDGKYRKSPKEFGRDMMMELLGDTFLKDLGFDLTKLSPKEQDKKMKEFIDQFFEMAEVVCKCARLMGEDWQEHVADKVTDNLAHVATVACGFYSNDMRSDGTHTTFISSPRNLVVGETLLSTMTKLVEDTLSRLYPIKTPLDLHRLTYKVLLVMALVEAKFAARMSMENIDVAGLMENPAVMDMVDPMNNKGFCDALKGKNFFTSKAKGNDNIDALDRQRKKESHDMYDKWGGGILDA